MPNPSAPDSSVRLDPLLARVATGDREAFAMLYRAASGTLFGICLRILRDRSEAEDVLQDVFVSVWHKAPQFDAERSLATTWLGSIARHRAIDRLRALPNVASRAPIEAIDNAADPAPSAPSITESAQQRSRLEECFRQLDERRRGLIKVAFFDGLTYEDLASRMSAPLGSVKSWIRRGLLQLRTCLEQ